MTHDPLCPYTPPVTDPDSYHGEHIVVLAQAVPCQCDLVAAVRADTLERARLMIPNIFGSAPFVFPTDDEAVRYVQESLVGLYRPLGNKQP
jgi:hypothetical protein